VVNASRAVGVEELNQLFERLKAWGKDDEKAAANLISDRKRPQAGRLILHGVSLGGALPPAVRPGPFDFNPGSHHPAWASDLVASEGLLRRAPRANAGSSIWLLRR
jgi:hypothetical protein